ncbi:MAG: helix-turn-helix transcriptional regulator [Planctomycetaceae bacterium]
MPRHFARHEQFLRIFALLETLSAARQPLDDQSLIAALKERLGLKELSTRTLHRDCDFLVACGYPLDHVPVPNARKQGWRIDREALAARQIPAEPITLLELVAFTIARDLLRPFEGTVLWTGMESLRHKLERSLPPSLRDRLESARDVFHVTDDCPSRYAARPRLISALSTAIADRQEIDVTAKAESGATSDHRLRPLRLLIDPPRVRLLALELAPPGDPPVLIDLERIETVTPRDTTFEPPAIDVAATIASALPRP